tara:strand:- start:853 stop:2235 length:1383 start_codon:yes stop_codon:yes gene_type:complete
MAHFNHAYNKAFYMKSGSLKQAGNTTALTTIGDFGVYDADTYTAFANVAAISVHAGGLTGPADATALAAGSYALGSQNKFILAQASWNQTDTIGGNVLHGGYAESIKSKDIQYRFINQIGAQQAVAGVNQIAILKIEGAADSKSCFECGTDPMLRIDIKGADALRMLNHNAYRNIDIGGLCNCCNSAGTFLDPIKVANEWAKKIAADPILSKMMTVTFEATTNAGGLWTNYPITVANNTATSTYDSEACLGTWTADNQARITFTMAVVDTQFGVCSFDTRDWTNTEPLLLNVEVLDESGKACATCKITEKLFNVDGDIDNGAPTTNGNIYFITDGTAGTTVPVHEVGNGTYALNDLLMTQNYMQSPYNQGNRDSSRFRTIEGSDLVLNNFPTNAQYHKLTLQHTVPRYNNPSGVFDNDQYRYTVYTEGGTNANAVTLKEYFVRMRTHAGIEALYPDETMA